MLLTISTTHRPATDLGYLLHKHPERLQTFSLAFGQAHVFYPEAGSERCTAALLLDIDPVGLDPGRETIETSSLRDGLQIDLVTHDVKKFFTMLLKRNGYVLEQL